MINKKSGFTLVELMIVISIIGIMMTTVYAPYNFFQKKAELKIASKEISKTLSESRNMAIHGVSSSNGNLSIGVYFDESNKNVIKIFGYPYDLGTGSLIVVNNDDYLLKEISIEPNIWINKIEGKEKVLFLYSAVSGKGNYFNFENIKEDLVISDNKISIDFSYKGGTSNLQKTLEYYIETYISDY